jgi:transposase
MSITGASLHHRSQTGPSLVVDRAMRHFGLLREQGYPVPTGARTVLARVAAVVDDAASSLPSLLRQTVRALIEEVHHLEARVADIDHELARIARAHLVATRLQQVPRVGTVTATALVGAVAHIHAFPAAAISRAGLASHRGNRPPGRAAISGGLANGAMDISAAS